MGEILIVAFIGSLIVFFLGGFILTWSIYEDGFGKRFNSDFNFYLNQTDFPDLGFEEMVFPTDNGNELKSYLYHKKETILETSDFKSLIVLSHGMGNGHNAYLADINAFVKSGYLVFAYDNTGTGKSEGEKIKGFPQSVVDLGKALDYIKKDSNLNKLPLGLYGHSWGGYSVMSILHKDYPVKAIIERSGPISFKSIFNSEAYKIVGRASILFNPLVSLIEYIKFGDISKYNALDAINSTNIPILLMHSKDDNKIPFEISPLREATFITNKNIQIRTFENRGHNILISDKAREYQKKVLKNRKELREQYESIPVDVKQIFMESIDLWKFNEIDSEIMKEIIHFFDEVFDN